MMSKVKCLHFTHCFCSPYTTSTIASQTNPYYELECPKCKKTLGYGLYFIKRTDEGDGLYFCSDPQCRKWFEAHAKAPGRFYTRREINQWTEREWDLSSTLTASFVKVHVKADEEQAVARKKAVKKSKARTTRTNAVKKSKAGAAASSASATTRTARKRKRKRKRIILSEVVDLISQLTKEIGVMNERVTELESKLEHKE